MRLLMPLALLCAGCDPIRLIRVTGPVLAPPVSDCVLDTLRKDTRFGHAGSTDEGVVYALLVVPPGLRAPEAQPEVSVNFTPSAAWGGDLTLEMIWVGAPPSPDYEHFAIAVMRELQFTLTTRCVPPSVL